MINLIIYLLAFFITIPIIATGLMYVVATKLKKQKIKALHFAVNWTTLLYIISVALIFSMIFEIKVMGYILILLILILASIITFQWKKDAEIHLRKAMKILWRFSFLLFLFLYICFVFTGIFMNIV